MAENAYKKEPDKKNEYKTVSAVRNAFDQFIGLDQMIAREGLPTSYIPYLLFFAFLGLIYIGNAHYAERMSRQINKAEEEVTTLRADYTSLEIEYLEATKKNEIIERLKPEIFTDNDGKTFRIKVKKDEY